MAKIILIVDDDPDVLTMLRKGLEFLNYDCFCANTVEDGLEMLEKTTPNLVLLDLGFASASGTAFLQNAKKKLKPGMTVPPVIVLSGHKDKDIVDYVLDLGAAGFIGKPYDLKKLSAMISDYLR